ncbi:hypothetical protein TNCV_327521 [Trichonephila clavipes]|nr:hypothetical protein TNCV_327521 [Trichonephila clavipes]
MTNGSGGLEVNATDFGAAISRVRALYLRRTAMQAKYFEAQTSSRLRGMKVRRTGAPAQVSCIHHLTMVQNSKALV